MTTVTEAFVGRAGISFILHRQFGAVVSVCGDVAGIFDVGNSNIRVKTVQLRIGVAAE